MSRAVRTRPPLFRALGRGEPPVQIHISGHEFTRERVFKHDSWAATALYSNSHGRVVCKFNRVESIFGLPMQSLGRWLACREATALHQLQGIRGVPIECGSVSVEGRCLPNAVAHWYIPGHPLGAREQPSKEFFPALKKLIETVHRRNVAHVDLHKRENILVGEDGLPYLLDFQVSFGLWHDRSRGNPLLTAVLRAWQRADWYHLAKHVRRCGHDPVAILGILAGRPWWVQAHRSMAVPLRTLRRTVLSAVGVRAKGGRATTEVFPEEAVRREWKRKRRAAA